MTQSTQLTLTLDGKDYELDCSYTQELLIPAIPRGWDEPGEPASGGEVCLLCAWHDGAVMPLTDAQIERVEMMIWESL